MLVSELPPPHNPSSCQHFERFQRIRNGLDRLEGDEIELDLKAGEIFIKTLGPEDRLQCHYHEADWKSIADASVQILDELGPDATNEEYEAAASALELDSVEQCWLVSLFRDPIAVKEMQEYNNGQHRACALRFSGADRAVVKTDGKSLPEISADWVYLGDG